MGMRGPAPKPTAIRIYEGNRARRPLNVREPKPEVKIPRCPGFLDAEARAEWKRLAPVLVRTRVLTEVDYHTLANLCVAFSTLSKAQRKLNESGLLIKTPNGFVQQSPLVSIVNQSMEQVTKLCREFGLTPASRTRIIIEQDDGFDELERALCS